jgi:hypothetical protein
MTQPGLPGNRIPKGEAAQARRYEQLEARIAALEAQALGGQGLVIASGKSIRSADFDGDIDTLTPGTHGWAFGGLLSGGVLNQLALPNGIIHNDALANPVTSDSANSPVVGNAFSTTAGTVVTTCHLTVPAGFTEAQILAFVNAGGLNPNGTADNLWARAVLNGGLGASAAAPVGVAAGLSAANMTIWNVTATVTPGQVITLSGQAWVDVAAWPASPANGVAIGLSATFLR